MEKKKECSDFSEVDELLSSCSWSCSYCPSALSLPFSCGWVGPKTPCKNLTVILIIIFILWEFLCFGNSK